MLFKSRVVCVLAAVLSLTSTAWAQFSFQGIGRGAASNSFSDGSGISGDGRVVLGAIGSFGTGSPWQTVLWTPATGLVPFVTSTANSSVFGISFDGSFLIGRGDTANGAEAIRWTSNGGAVALGDLPGNGPFSSAALGVSADGAVVVGQSARTFPVLRAFRWTAATGMVDLGDLPGGEVQASATAVTADGNVVVGGSSGAAGQEAFVWKATTGMVGLGNLPGGSSSLAKAVSADGKVVVGMGINATGVFEAFRWTQETGMIGLGSLDPHDFTSIAYGVSADGKVVGGIGSGAADLNGEAFVWFPGTGMLNLQDYLVAHGVTSVQSWRKLTGVSGVSADGKTLCGTGVNPQGQTEGWVAHIEIDTTPAPPPPPPTPADTTETLSPTTFSVLAGTLVSGGVTQLQSSDNTYLTLQATAKNPMQVAITAQASRANATELRLAVEAVAEGSSTRQEIALFDYTSRTWVTLNTKTATTSDTTVEVRTTDRPKRFIEPGTLRVQARVTFTPSGAKKVITRARIDRILWTRVP